MVMRVHGGGCLAYQLHFECFDSQFHVDFTRILPTFYRGGVSYHRPIGSERYALKMLGVYDNDDWLELRGDQFLSQRHRKRIADRNRTTSSGHWPTTEL